jgi:hypothetical protein
MSFKVYCDEHKATHTLTDGQAERIIYMQMTLNSDLSQNPSLPHELAVCVAELLFNSSMDMAYKTDIDALVALRAATTVNV